jgi:putative sterol carrier protein
MKASDLIKRLPEVVNSKGAENVNAIIQYDISEPMYQVVENGEMSIHEGTNENAHLTITMADNDLVSLFKGELNPMMAFMSGKIKLKGDMMLAQKLVGFVDQEKVSQLA